MLGCVSQDGWLWFCNTEFPGAVQTPCITASKEENKTHLLSSDLNVGKLNGHPASPCDL